LLWLTVVSVAVLLGATASAGARTFEPARGTLLGPKPALRLLIGFKVYYRDLLHHHEDLVRIAYLILPRWYRPGKDPGIPLVISPDGHGVAAAGNIRLWGGLPAFGPFAMVTPDGQGRRLPLYSWGWRGQGAPTLVGRGEGQSPFENVA